MAYIRRNTTDGVTVMNKDLYDNLQDGIEQFGVTPQMFGAKGDGVTDDTDSIKQAVQHSKGLLVIPKGIYLISSPIDVPEGVLIKGFGPRLTVLQANHNFQGDYLIKIHTLNQGGGLMNLSLIGDNSILCSGLILGSSKENVSVNSGFIVSDLICSNFGLNGIEYLSGWQVTFHDLYISGCKNIGFLIEGADTTYHDINISNCKCGLYMNSGTSKLSNIKIDNCDTGDGFAVYLKGERNSITNFEVQYCAPNGVLVSGRYNSFCGILIDSIGKLVDGTIKDTGHSISFGVNYYNKCDFFVRNYGNTKIISYFGEGIFGYDLNYLYNLIKTSDITIHSETESILTLENNNDYEIPNDLGILIQKGVLSSPNTEEGFPKYTSNFKLNINQDIVPDLGEYKSMYLLLDFRTDGDVSSSIYKGSTSVVGPHLSVSEKNPIIGYYPLKEGTKDFIIYISSTKEIELRKIKVVLFKRLSKTNLVFN